MTGTDQPFSLTILIPVYNDADGLARLIAQIATRDLADRVIVVDDMSDTPVTAQDLPGAAGLADRLTVLRQKTQGGAGAARNRGLDLVETSHVLFFDSDDWFLDPMTEILAEIRDSGDIQSADFTLFRHCDSRMRTKGRPGPLNGDQKLWDAAGISQDAEGIAPLPRASWPDMVGLAAYPWNKIYRTGFLREAEIRCTEIPVHNDVELHWASFLAARDIRVSTALGCEHVVVPGGGRLTNRSGAERLQVFEALKAVLARLKAQLRVQPGSADFIDPYLRFEQNLFRWIRGGIAPELAPQFDDAVIQHLMQLDPALLPLADPATLRQIRTCLMKAL